MTIRDLINYNIKRDDHIHGIIYFFNKNDFEIELFKNKKDKDYDWYKRYGHYNLRSFCNYSDGSYDEITVKNHLEKIYDNSKFN